MPKESVFTAFPELHTARLLLRALRAEDAPALYAVLADPAVTRFYDVPPLTTVDQAAELLARFASRYQHQIGLRWAIAPRATPEVLLGTCGFNAWFQAARRAVMGFELGRPHWGQGIMSEAVGAIVAFGFQDLGLHRVEALTVRGHRAAGRLLRRAGFRVEGVLRQYEPIRGRPTDMVMHARLHSDPLPAAP